MRHKTGTPLFLVVDLFALTHAMTAQLHRKFKSRFPELAGKEGEDDPHQPYIRNL